MQDDQIIAQGKRKQNLLTPVKNQRIPAAKSGLKIQTDGRSFCKRDFFLRQPYPAGPCSIKKPSGFLKVLLCIPVIISSGT